jgi:hypothetical protein
LTKKDLKTRVVPSTKTDGSGKNQVILEIIVDKKEKIGVHRNKHNWKYSRLGQ